MKPLEIPADIAPVSHETAEKLRHYYSLLLKWQEKINLISPNTVPDAWKRHFIDSAQIAPLLPTAAKTLYDLGSGAGFAGMVLAILRPDITVTLIESDAKKCAFLAAVSRETSTPVKILIERIESARDGLKAPDLVTARALAGLDNLFAYAWPWAAENPDLRLIFPKGGQAQAEIEAAQTAGWLFDAVKTPSKTERSAQILSIANLGKKQG
jgi:16S rRNA (guanine527-N7)-methyltransferase